MHLAAWLCVRSLSFSCGRTRVYRLPSCRLSCMEMSKRSFSDMDASCADRGDRSSHPLYSPYERRIGKRISVCSKCHGEGKVRSVSKKAKARKKRVENGDDAVAGAKANAEIVTRPCKHCDGMGLSLTDLESAPINHDIKISNNLDKISTASNITVAIIGGGIGGFALAAALQHRNINCVVYERDVEFDERKQGYGLTMQQGARALRSLGFTSKLGIHSTRHAVHSSDGSILGEWGSAVWGARYEQSGRSHATRQNAHVSRQNLRKHLMEMLRDGTVRWGHRFLGYEKVQSGDGECGLKLRFSRRGHNIQGRGITYHEEEITETASIVVGCDGIRSAARTCKLGENITPLRYLDCIVILGIGPSPQNSTLTDGKTVFQTADGVTRLYAMPFAAPGEEIGGIATNDKGLSMWQLSFPMDETDAINLSELGPSALKNEALQRCGTWHDPIPRLLQSTPDDLVTGYPCYDRALVDKSDLRGGYDSAQPAHALVTLLGDAAHPMSPFKGQGANQALLDAVLLAQKLYGAVRKNDKIKSSLGDLILTALVEFEDEMLKRCAVKVRKSAEAARFLHSKVAIKEGNVTRGAAFSLDTYTK